MKVLVHCVDICKVNDWLTYRRHADQLCVQKKKKKIRWLCWASLLKLQAEFVWSQTYIDRPVARLTKRKLLDDYLEGPGQRISAPTPSKCVRTDENGNWPVFQDS